MRIGLISDIHGNLPALDAVLAKLDEEAVDRLICLGDIAVGPWPSDTVKRVAALDCACIVGNWDAWMLDGVPPVGDSDAGRMLLEMGSFWAEQLDEDDLAFMRLAEPEARIEVDGVSETVGVSVSSASYNSDSRRDADRKARAHAQGVTRRSSRRARTCRWPRLRSADRQPRAWGCVLEWPVAARVCRWASTASSTTRKTQRAACGGRRTTPTR
jgi:hypothetical protein